MAARDKVDAYARSAVYTGPGIGDAQDYAPKAFDALVAVLAVCDRDDRESIGLVGTDKIRAAIEEALS
jgi:hypothetical protein